MTDADHQAQALSAGIDATVRGPWSSSTLDAATLIPMVAGLPVQCEIAARNRAASELLREHQVLKAVSESLSLFVSGGDPHEMFDQLLRRLLDLTDSEYGFIGDVESDEAGHPRLRTLTRSNVLWGASRRDAFERSNAADLQTIDLNLMFGEAMRTGRPIVSSVPAMDPRRGEIPDGIPPLTAFLGMPIQKGGKVVGLVGLANRPTGYTLDDVQIVAPLLSTIGELIDAHSRDQKRRETERSLREAEEWLEETARVASVGAWQLDAATMKLRWSAQTRLIHEAPPDFVPDLESAVAFYSGDVRTRIQEAVQRGLRDGSPWDLEFPFTTGSGQSRWVRAIGHASIEDGKVTRVFGTFQDITKRRVAEAEKENLQARVQQSQKMESVGRLAGGIAHDFNNMLAVILGHTEMLLLDDSLSPQQRIHLKAIQAAGQRSADLTHQLLTFARRQNAAPQNVDPNKAVRGILDLLRKSVGENVLLEWLPGSGIGTVRIDPMQLEQILASLCINSRDAISGAGRILISTCYERAHVPRQLRSAELPAGDYVVLTVSDSGCGMSEAALNYLFEPFNTTKPVGEGSGLGLAAVYGIVQQVGGGIDVHSDPTIGTTFRIYLPCAIGVTSEKKPDQENSGDGNLCEHRRTVLIVDDEPALLRLGNLLLTRLGHAVYTARNAREALQLVQAHGGSIDVVISDVVLPDLNGWELARRICQMQPATRFAFMSGYGAEQGKIGQPKQHSFSVLIKPFNLDRLASAVHDAIRLHGIDEVPEGDQD